MFGEQEQDRHVHPPHRPPQVDVERETGEQEPGGGLPQPVAVLGDVLLPLPRAGDKPRHPIDDRAHALVPLHDLYGRRRTYLVGLVVFTVSSLLCGLAPTATTLIIARFVQGAGAALMMPQIMSIIQIRFAGAARPRTYDVSS